jgi:hypothetical protein
VRLGAVAKGRVVEIDACGAGHGGR